MENVKYLYPEKAITILRTAQYDPAAQMEYELVSGSIVWSDEGQMEFSDVCCIDD